MHDETRTTAGQRHEPAHRTRNMTETPEERSHRLDIVIDSHSTSTHSQNNSFFFSLLVPSCMIHSAVLFSLLSHTCFIFISNFPQNWVSQAWCACSYEHATFIFRGISRQRTKQSPLSHTASFSSTMCTKMSASFLYKKKKNMISHFRKYSGQVIITTVQAQA